MPNSRRMAVLPLALSLLVPRAAVAQDPRLERRLDSATFRSVSAVIDSADRLGLPVEAMVQRALEGAAKHASSAQIVAAVRRLGQDLGAARDALGAASSQAEIVAAASALRGGVRVTDLTRLRQRRTQDLTVALATLADLVTTGVPPDSAAAAVIALAASARDDQIADFRRAVERDIALGAPPAAATAVRVDATLRQTAGITSKRP
ncbi:MAG TPA: hypothetical protein VIV56_00870 [Gemmatimonadales bacterium]